MWLPLEQVRKNNMSGFSISTSNMEVVTSCLASNRPQIQVYKNILTQVTFLFLYKHHQMLERKHFCLALQQNSTIEFFFFNRGDLFRPDSPNYDKILINVGWETLWDEPSFCDPWGHLNWGRSGQEGQANLTPKWAWHTWVQMATWEVDGPSLHPSTWHP